MAMTAPLSLTGRKNPSVALAIAIRLPGAASTMTSQMVDTTAVILITHFYANALPVNADEPLFGQLMTFIISGYVFKLVVALVDTVPFYVGTHYLSRYLHIDRAKEHDADAEESEG